MTAAIWHDVECGAYEADLLLWEELADENGGPILDLGCGTGRVALHLARRSHRVLGLDRDTDLVAVLAERAGGLPAEAEVGDARSFDLGVEFDTVLAPMQLLQLFEGPEERVGSLRCAAEHLRPGGLTAVAIVDGLNNPTSPSSRFFTPSETKRELSPPVPDVREVEGWVYSSLPLETVVDESAIVVRRLRQTVDPTGDLSEEVDEIRLQTLDSATVESEARQAGLRPAGRRTIDPTDAHVGSTVVLLEKES